MECVSSWEHKMLTDELAQGMEKAVQLRLHLCSITSLSEAEDLLLQRIIATFEKALYILKWNAGPVGQLQLGAATSTAAPESSTSVDGSPKCEDTNKNHGDRYDYGDTSKKRKLQPTWVEQVKVNSAHALEGPRDDGYSWRKYGQKDILGAKYPRSYYRCTYRAGRNCWATKQVQRSDEDPTLFEITYKGTHTCSQSNYAVPLPASPGKQELKHKHAHYHQLEQQNEKLSNFKANLRVNTEDLEIQEMPAHFSFPSTFGSHDTENHRSPISAIADDNHMGVNSPFFYSPATSESNYFSATPYQMTTQVGAPMHHHSEADVADIISAHASTSNSPIGGMEFSIDTADLDPNFPFNILGFFT